MKHWCAILMVFSCLLCLTACADTGETDEPSSARTTFTTVNVLDVSLRDLISKDQLEQMTGQTLQEPEIKENGTQLYALSVDGRFSVKINLDKQDRSRFDAMIATFPDAVQAPNLGDTAVFVPQYKTLFVYGKGYALDVGMSGADIGEDGALLLSRQFAALLLEKL